MIFAYTVNFTKIIANGALAVLPNIHKRDWQGDETYRKGEDKSLKPAFFTRHMEKLPDNRWVPVMSPLWVDEVIQNTVEAAIRKATNNKATGVNKYFRKHSRVIIA